VLRAARTGRAAPWESLEGTRTRWSVPEVRPDSTA